MYKGSEMYINPRIIFQWGKRKEDFRVASVIKSGQNLVDTLWSAPGWEN